MLVKRARLRELHRILALAVAGMFVLGSCGGRSQLDTPLRVVAPQIVAACVNFVSCGPFPHDGLFRSYAGVSDCIWRSVASTAYPTALPIDLLTVASSDCLSMARGCNEVNACVTGVIDCTAAPHGSCFGDRVAYCPALPPTSLVRDCSITQPTDDSGSSCFVGTSGLATCGVGTCVAPPSVACDGNTAQMCDDGVSHRQTCPVGSVCVPSSNGGECVGSGPACNSSRCEQDTSILCVGGRELPIACSALSINGTCSTAATAAATLGCVPAADLACDPTTFAERCDGSRLVYCDGTEREIDCTSVGFVTCIAASGHARCGS